MSSEKKKKKLKEKSCTDCGTLNCYRQEKEFPDFCPTESVDPDEIDGITAGYRGEGMDARIARASAEIEGVYYGKLTRAEEIIAFANRLGLKKIGLATCIGLSEEARIYSRVLKANGLECYSALCKIGSVDKTGIGMDESFKIQQGSHEAICNPILQAKMLERQGTELNVIIGLCVGHDSLFMKHSTAPVTTLITKDRVLGHNPAAALYTCGFYYKRLFDGERKL
jgi:uncharacterized metal-binding protein